MAKQTINIGASPNDGTGTPLRTSFDYCNQNFTELYTATGPSGNNIVVPGNATITGALTVQGVGGISIGSASFTSGRALSATSPAGSGVGIRLLQSATSDWEISNVATAGNLSITQSGANLLSLTGAGVFTFGDGAGGTRMTLNSTGLGVGRSPIAKLNVDKASQTPGGTTPNGAFVITDNAGSNLALEFGVNSASLPWIQSRNSTTNTSYDLLINPIGGNVGVGVTPSASWNAAFKAIQIGSGNYLSIAAQNTVAARGSILWNAIGSGDEAFVYRSTGDAANRFMIGSGFFAWYTAPSGTAGNAITFTQAMTLDASGNFLLNTSTANSSLIQGFNVYFNGGSTQSFIGHITGTSSGAYYTGYSYNGSLIGSITQNGTTGVLFNTSSDYRLKEAVQPLTGGLARINALKPSIYKWKSDGSSGEGFIAHELAEVVPLAVTGEKDAVNEDGSIKPQGVDLSRVVPILVAAIKELSAEVNALKNA